MTLSFVVWMIENSMFNYVGAQGTFSPPSVICDCGCVLVLVV